MADLMAWALLMCDGEYRWTAGGGGNWQRELNRFLDGLAALDRRLAADAPLGYPPEILIQAPLADALTHVGQLAMLRGAAGAPVRPESYARAQSVAGRVGLDQAPAGFEFDSDASENLRDDRERDVSRAMCLSTCRLTSGTLTCCGAVYKPRA